MTILQNASIFSAFRFRRKQRDTIIMPRCISCGKDGKLSCSRCKSVNYCSKECQVNHWKRGHKGECTVLSSLASTDFIKSLPDSPKEKKESAKVEERKLDNNGTSKLEELPTSQWLFPPERVTKMASFYPLLNVGKGLSNFGNSCYMNSVLQCYIHTLPLFNYFASNAHSFGDCPLSKGDKFCMLCQMYHLLCQVFNQSGPDYFVPREIYRNIKSIGEFAFYQQEDAHDFSYGVLNSLQKSLLALESSKPTFKQEDTSLIYQLFGGHIQSVIKCKTCNNISSSFETFLDVMLDFEDGNLSSIEEALRNYTKIEQLDESVGWRCSKCEKAVVAEKQLTIYNSPNILCLTLKRFMGQGGTKLNRPVVFREDLNLSRFMSNSTQEKRSEYELYAIVVHYGNSVFVGHYVSFVKINGMWYLFDDHNVTEVDQSVVLKQNAYMMFYQKLHGDRKANTKVSQRSKEMPVISSSSEATVDGNTGKRIGLNGSGGVQRPVSNVEETSYSKLYQDITQTSGNVNDQYKAMEERQNLHKKSLKATGRNEDCPCGSGKKFKKCHGVA